MRNCRKCDEKIPYRIKINEKFHYLTNRKFCLNCSPFGKHNTKADDPNSEPKKKPYHKYTSEQKDNIKRILYKRGLERKISLVISKGGCCKLCGYKKCLRSLSFHHRNPEDKKFTLSINILWSKSWKDIQEEADKCDLLCANCHAEIEDSISYNNLAWYSKVVKDLSKDW